MAIRLSSWKRGAKKSSESEVLLDKWDSKLQSSLRISSQPSLSLSQKGHLVEYSFRSGAKFCDYQQ